MLWRKRKQLTPSLSEPTLRGPARHEPARRGLERRGPGQRGGAVDPAHNYGVTPVDPIADIVSLIDRGADAQYIVDRALAIPTGDNVTAILITL